jgi:nickel superoxide dismutase
VGHDPEAAAIGAGSRVVAPDLDAVAPHDNGPLDEHTERVAGVTHHDEVSGSHAGEPEYDQAIAGVQGGAHAVARHNDPPQGFRPAPPGGPRQQSHQTEVPMSRITHILTALDRRCAPTIAHAHCDLPCGVYDPAQARIEAESVKAIMEKFHEEQDPVFRQRAVLIKEQRAELVKHHLWVLWTDYFTPEHLEQFPDLHELVWKATKAAGDAKASTDPADGQKLLTLVDEIADIFWKTKN